MSAASHWEAVYRAKQPQEMSWFQREATLSLDWIRRVAPPPDAAVIDVGGGASTLADRLVRAGYRHLTVLDIAPSGLAHARARLGPAASAITWIEADALTADLPPAAFDLWHDRAVFHFLTDAADRARYVEQLRRSVRPGGHAIVATFAEDGPERCSGLPVVRYSAERLQAEFDGVARVIESVREQHTTPTGARQSFIYCIARVDGGGA